MDSLSAAHHCLGTKGMRSRSDLDPDSYFFRGLHPNVFIGTASDRYAGWLGQIYSEDLYKGRITSRTNRVAGRSFKETVLPVDCVREYFEHFRTLEVDYTFYQLLLDSDGKPTQAFHALKSYLQYMASGDSVILKVPQAVSAQKIRRGSGYAANETYLNAEVFTRRFYAPATDLLGAYLKGFVFEQEYQRKDERVPSPEVAGRLSGFFGTIPPDHRYHVELRTESYLDKAIFAVLEDFGIGQVLSHWTWLPPLSAQFAKSGQRFFNSGQQAVIRLMTPLGTRYEDAYAQAFPFDRLVEGMLQPRMIDDTVKIAMEGIGQEVGINIIINNRAGGNAPRIAQLIADRFLSIRADAPA